MKIKEKAEILTQEYFQKRGNMLKRGTLTPRYGFTVKSSQDTKIVVMINIYFLHFSHDILYINFVIGTFVSKRS